MKKKAIYITTAKPGTTETLVNGLKKFTDTDLKTTGKSSEYWDQRKFKEFYLQISNKPPKLSNKFFNLDPDTALIQTFKLKGLQYGNWENQEVRFNYIVATIISFFDLDLILNFGENIGFNVLSIAFGARGKGSAAAHFEPSLFVINLTRFKRADKLLKQAKEAGYNITLPDDLDKRNKLLFETTGGVSALAHEYGHFIDSLFGAYFEPNKSNYGLTQGHSTIYKYGELDNLKKGSLRYQVQELLLLIIYDRVKDTYNDSEYYTRLKKTVKQEYWFRQCEIWARAFEVYISMKQNEKGIRNKFLSELKYETPVYLTPTEMKKKGIFKKFDEIFKTISLKARSKPILMDPQKSLF